jgi:aryl-alcohol dehydrogenase-like predicted oxidoreductase
VLRQLGQTKISLSPIGLGTWQFSSGKGELGQYWPALSDSNTQAIVKAAIANSVNWFDTAESYGNGASEKNLSNALSVLDVARGTVKIADKWWPKNRQASSIVDSISERLDQLQGYPIDLYQIHWPESESWLRTEMKALAQLVDEGKVKSVGLCNYHRRDIKRAHRYLRRRGIPLASVQLHYNLAYRHSEKNDVLKMAKDLGMSVIAWSPLEQGLLSGKFHSQQNPDALKQLKQARLNMFGLTPARITETQALINALETIAGKHNATAAQISLAWITQFHGNLMFAIPGANSAEQAQSNSAAMHISLTQTELAELDEVSSKLST